MRQKFIQEGTSRRKDSQTVENFYYEAIYTALREENLRDTTFLTLKQLKAKIVRLYHKPHHHLFLDNDDQNETEDEEPSLPHVLKRYKRQESRMVNSVYHVRQRRKHPDHANEHPTYLQNVHEKEI